MIQTPSQSDIWFQRYELFLKFKNNVKHKNLSPFKACNSKSIFPTSDSFLLIMSHIPKGRYVVNLQNVTDFKSLHFILVLPLVVNIKVALKMRYISSTSDWWEFYQEIEHLLMKKWVKNVGSVATFVWNCNNFSLSVNVNSGLKVREF